MHNYHPVVLEKIDLSLQQGQLAAQLQIFLSQKFTSLGQIVKLGDGRSGLHIISEVAICCEEIVRAYFLASGRGHK